jgi:hypothetical protein
MKHQLKILLLEPGYRNKYPPLGLMKIASYHGSYGKQDFVKFAKGEDNSLYDTGWDRIYITTLFSFEWRATERCIDFAVSLVGGATNKIFVGGIAASLIHDSFLAEKKWHGIRFIKGLLDDAPAVSLQLDEFDGDFYCDDITGTPIEEHFPDYSILEDVEYDYAVKDAYFAYASRGCIRKCKFCGVPKLEGAQRQTPSLLPLIEAVKERHGEKKDLVLMDNNVVAAPNFREIIAEIRDLGFERGAVIYRKRRPIQRRVDFNQGVDARILCKSPEFLKQISTIAIRPLRIAFDHTGVTKPYEQSIRFAAEVGIRDLSNYMLYNFYDDPQDLYARMYKNIQLNEELDIRIYSFPMRYQPVDLKDRSHIGKKWSRYWLRSFQIMLQATHGIVSGAPSFFRKAYGANVDEFSQLLWYPEKFLFNRNYYSEMDGKAELAEYSSLTAKLTQGETEELHNILGDKVRKDLNGISALTKTKRVREVASFYEPLTKLQEHKIWTKAKVAKWQTKSQPLPAADEIVEDAGLAA